MKKPIAVYLTLTISLLFPILAGGQTMDGSIGPNEYGQSVDLDGGNYRIHWQTKGDTIFFALAVETEGWVAVGAGPGPVMADADMIFGWVDDSGKTTVIDTFSTDTDKFWITLQLKR